MSKKLELKDQEFWKAVKYLLELDQETPKQKILDELELSDDEFSSLLSFFDSIHYSFKQKNGFLMPSEDRPLINVEFSLLEWLQFQANFPAISENMARLNLFDDLKNKLTSLEVQYSKYDLFAPIEVMNKVTCLESSMSNIIQECVNSELPHEELLHYHLDEKMLAQIESCIEGNHSLSLFLLNGKKIDVYPHRLVHFDGRMSLVCEDKVDKSIVHLYLNDVEKIEIFETNHPPAFTKIEIDDFINSLRAISETEIRLILKFNPNKAPKEKPSFQHLGNPCLITNTKGEHIWAASVEPCEALMEWLYEIGPDIEILDPANFREDFLSYCEDKLKKIA